jgi:hypothetical protein
MEEGARGQDSREKERERAREREQAYVNGRCGVGCKTDHKEIYMFDKTRWSTFGKIVIN